MYSHLEHVKTKTEHGIDPPLPFLLLMLSWCNVMRTMFGKSKGSLFPTSP